ncbi:MAG: DedA family protein [Candidatus Pacearchaeota archaeon]|nr:DedA family protein [Candidatus Pacearchaeota archaeon]
MWETINLLISDGGIWVIFILMFINGLVSTIPSEAVLFFAGIFSKISGQNFFLILLIAALGNLFGTCILYFIGRTIGYNWIFRIKLIKKFVHKETLDNAAKKFRKDGAHWVGIFRCLPHVRSIISLPAGMIKMPFHLFLIYSFIGMFLWAIFWQGIGYYVGVAFFDFKVYISLFFIAFLIIFLFLFKKRIDGFLQKEKIKD